MKTQIMIAFHGKKSLKNKYLKRVRAHRAADELVKMATAGWRGDGSFKGCAVVCTMDKYDHAAYETEIGVPRILARLEDSIFEGLPHAEAMAWPEQFLEAIPVGADLSRISDQFLHWLLVDGEDGVISYAKTERARKAILAVGSLFERKLKGETVDVEEWRKAYDAAYAAAAYYAAYYAACAATDNDDADAAYAYAAEDDYGSAAARYKARIIQSQKLVELLLASPM